MTPGRIAIMPARGGSKRLPGKNIAEFFGAPLLARSLSAARQSELFDTIHVSTDSAQIAEVAAALGHPVDFMRDAGLADDQTPLLPVAKWTLAQYAARGKRFGTVCLLMPTAPLIEAEDLRRAEALYRKHGGRHAVLAVARFPAPVEWALELAPDGQLTPREPGQMQRRSQDLEPAYYDAGAFVFYPAATVTAGQSDDRNFLAYVLDRHKAVDIDDADDLEFARVLMRGRRPGHEIK
jgi:pseudaminic acid cytidylyltransferase